MLICFGNFLGYLQPKLFCTKNINTKVTCARIICIGSSYIKVAYCAESDCISNIDDVNTCIKYINIKAIYIKTFYISKG